MSEAHAQKPRGKNLSVGSALLTPLLLALTLFGCGGGGATRGASAREQAEVARGRAEHPVNMFPVVKAPAGEEGEAVVRVGAVAVPRASFVHWAKVLTPKLASYEPASRGDCSPTRAGLEMKLSNHDVSGLAVPQIQALCVRVKQGLVKKAALEQLISNQWVIGEAAELGLGVSEAEAKQRLDRELVGLKRKEVAEFVTPGGRTVADALLGTRLSIATQRILDYVEGKAKRKLTEEAIARYYRSHEKGFATPETRDIRAVRTWTRAAISKAMAEVRSGKPIADVASRVSIDRPSNEHGGLIAGIVKGQEEQGLDQAIFAAKPHVLVGPLHLRKRYYVFEVVNVTPEKKASFKAIERQVTEKLSEELVNREKADFIRAFRKKWLARTSCRAGYVVSRCREWRGPSVVVSENAYDLT